MAPVPENYSPPQWLAGLQGLEDPSSEEFILRPDLRQVATFFLGWLFVVSCQYVFYSPFLHSMLSRISHSFRSQPSTIDLTEEKSTTRLSSSSSIRLRPPPGLVLAINFCFLLSSVAQFSSLLAFDPTADPACTFLVAWGELTAQAGRILCLLLVSLELKSAGVRRWETFAIWTALIVAAVGMFLADAISVGALRTIGPIPTFALCYRKHSIITSAISCGVNIVLELYALARIISLVPSFLSLRHKLGMLWNAQIGRISSLILLEAMIIYPGMVPIGLLADFVPFSLGSIILLAAFNYDSPQTKTPPITDIPHSHAPSTHSSIPQIRLPIDHRELSWPSHISEARPQQNVQTLQIPTDMSRHPYGAWQTLRPKQSAESVLAESIRNAVEEIRLPPDFAEGLAADQKDARRRGKKKEWRRSFLALESPRTRAILPDQYTESYPRPTPQSPAVPPRPPRKGKPPTPLTSTWTEFKEAAEPGALTPNDSVILGSDILRPGSGSVSHNARHDGSSESPRSRQSFYSSSSLHTQGFKRQSITSGRTVLATGSPTDPDTKAGHRPTFGEAGFETFKASGVVVAASNEGSPPVEITPPTSTPPVSFGVRPRSRLVKDPSRRGSMGLAGVPRRKGTSRSRPTT